MESGYRSSSAEDSLMSTVPILKSVGLQTSDNQLSGVADGGMVKCDNLVHRTKFLLESRRGQQFLGYTFGSGSDRGKEGTFFENALVQHYGSKLTRDTGGAFSDYSGSYTAPDEALLRMKFMEAALNLYFTTNAGIYALESITGTPRHAGIPKSLDFHYKAFQLSGSSGFMAKGKSVAYRSVLLRRDAHGKLYIGAPSGRGVVINPADMAIPAGGLNRTASPLVFATFAGHGLSIGSIISLNLTPGEADGGADFAAGAKTVTVDSESVMEWSEAGTNGVSGTDQTLQSGNRNVAMTIPLPTDATTEHILRVYRSETFPSTVTPSDELFICYETRLTAAQIAAGVVTFTDNCPEDFLGSGLYTNPNTGVGILQSNEPPPLAKDIVYFQNRAFYFNTTQKYRLRLRLLGTDTIANNDTLVVGGVEYRGDTGFYTEEFGIWHIFKSGTASQNIELTARSIIMAINSSSLTTGIYASYASGDDDAPGEILFEERGIGGARFSAGFLTHGTAFSPPLPQRFTIAAGALTRTADVVTATTGAVHGFIAGQVVQVSVAVGAAIDPNYPPGEKTIIAVPTTTTFTYAEVGTTAVSTKATVVHSIVVPADNNRSPAGFCYSKIDEPESVPPENYKSVGPANHQVTRALLSREKLFSFTENGKIYTITNGPPFRVDELDGTAVLDAPDTAKNHNNQIFAYTSQGIVSVTDSGVRILSKDIETELLELFGSSAAAVKRYAFALSYESERQYIIGLPTGPNDTACNQLYAYNSILGTWDRWPISRTWGAVHPATRLLYMGEATANKVRVERKSYDRTDYADELLSVTISSFSGRDVVLTSVSGLTIGDMLFQSEAVKAIIESINTDTKTVTLFSTENWVAGTANVLVAIDCYGKWVPFSGGSPKILKQFRDATIHFAKLLCNGIKLVFDNERNYVESEATAQNQGFGASFGEVPFGQQVGPKNVWASVPQNHAYGSQLRVGFRIREARSIWAINGYSVTWDDVGEDAD
jgi:hypothetical protein